MGAVISTVGSWLQSGYDLAVGLAKRIWEAALSLFEKVSGAVKYILDKMASSFCYTRDRYWVQSGTTRTEVGHDHLRVGAESNTQPAPQQPSVPVQRESPRLPSDPVERDKEFDKMMEGAKMLAEVQEPMQEYLNKLEKLRAEDKVNPQRTEQKLKELENEPCVKKICEVLPMVPPGLA